MEGHSFHSKSQAWGRMGELKREEEKSVGGFKPGTALNCLKSLRVKTYE